MLSLGRITTLHRFDPVGRCIYCGARSEDVVLSDEHIIPLSIGGLFLLPQASCAECAGKTSYVEGYIARNLFWEYRLAENVTSRRSTKGRPKNLPHRVRLRNGVLKEVVSPIADHPSTIAMPHWSMPTIYNKGNTFLPKGAPKGEINDFWEYTKIKSWTVRDTSWHANPDVKALRIKVEINLIAFARLLAKIAHGWSIAHLGLDSFEPLLPDLILGKTENAAYFIGSEWRLSDPTKDGGIEVAGGFQKIDGDNYVLARIRLLTFLGLPDGPGRGTPTYWVVVGKDTKNLRSSMEHTLQYSL